MKEKKSDMISKLGLPIFSLFIVGFAYFVLIPAINLRSLGFWVFSIASISFVMYMLCIGLEDTPKGVRIIKICASVPAIMVSIVIVGLFSSSYIFNAKAYSDMLKPYIKEDNISTYQAKLENVPLLDKASAVLISNRELGGLSDVVSQFEMGTNYQITMNGKPVRISPLYYGGFFKWLNNRQQGTPGYVMIDMRTQEAELVRVEGGLKYSPNENMFSGRNLKRHIRKNYPSALISEYTFELDEEGKPYWIVPIEKRTIGLFGGTDIDYVLSVNATTGEINKYKIGEVPDWIDNVYPTSLIVSQYDNYGSLQGGFLNSIFNQIGVRVTTDGYNYIPQENDNWIYTGVTSSGRDESNIGFILANKRTKEIIYYPISGAEEYSAMSSAEGVVQHLGYTSTFPLLLQIEGQPTYVVSLKDAGGLVKMYGMVNVEKYQIVSTGDTIQSCLKRYRELLKSNGATITKDSSNVVEGQIEDIRTASKEGTTYYYIKLVNNSKYYAVSVLDSEEVILLNIGDIIKLDIESVSDSIVPAILTK